jgi:hypothetical protein
LKPHKEICKIGRNTKSISKQRLKRRTKPMPKIAVEAFDNQKLMKQIIICLHAVFSLKTSDKILNVYINIKKIYIIFLHF